MSNNVRCCIAPSEDSLSVTGPSSSFKSVSTLERCFHPCLKQPSCTSLSVLHLLALTFIYLWGVHACHNVRLGGLKAMFMNGFYPSTMRVLGINQVIRLGNMQLYSLSPDWLVGLCTREFITCNTPLSLFICDHLSCCKVCPEGTKASIAAFRQSPFSDMVPGV